jgi:hypothetical protein
MTNIMTCLRQSLPDWLHDAQSFVSSIKQISGFFVQSYVIL